MLCTRVFSGPIALIYWIAHRRMGADPKRFSERLGRGSAGLGDPVLWFHAASLGEVMQIAPLVGHLTQTEQTRILVTTTTATSASWVAREMPLVTHRFAPLDTPSAVAGFLDGWSISAAIFVEGDLWPRLLNGLKTRDVPQILLNARNSRTRARFPAVFEALLAPFALVTCRSEAVADSLGALGLPPERIHVLPDLRLTVPKLAAPQDMVELLSDAIGSRPVWVAASTHPADEDAVLQAHQTVLDRFPDALLIIAPRHPIRGDALYKLTKAMAFTVARRSLAQDVLPDTQVYIADTLGELGVFFSLSSIVFLGGSFGQEGGHNPYEPAQFATALVSGPHVKNFADAYAALQQAGAATRVEDVTSLGGVIVDLMCSGQEKSMGQAGFLLMQETEDSMVKTADLIAAVLRRAQSRNG